MILKKYVCEWCGRIFKTRQDLEDHVKMFRRFATCRRVATYSRESTVRRWSLHRTGKLKHAKEGEVVEPEYVERPIVTIPAIVIPTPPVTFKVTVRQPRLRRLVTWLRRKLRL